MQKDFLTKSRRVVYKSLYIQVIAIVSLALVFWLIQGVVSMWSVLLGGVAWLIPSFYFIRKCFIVSRRCTPQQLVKKFYVAEVLKLVASGLLVVLFVKFISFNILPFLCGYGAAVLTIWFMPYVYGHR